jgi:hypothetical protein
MEITVDSLSEVRVRAANFYGFSFRITCQGWQLSWIIFPKYMSGLTVIVDYLFEVYKMNAQWI